MARAMDKQMAQSEKIRLNFVKGSYSGRNFIMSSETINISRYESLGSFRQKMEIGVKRKINMGEAIDLRVAQMMTKSESSFIFDEMLVEDEATPIGLGMVDDDTMIMMMQKDVIKNPGPNVMKTIERTKRKAKEISVGLNVLVGGAEGGLPLIGSPGPCSAPKCREQLAKLRANLLPALTMVTDEMMASGMLPVHRPDFSKVGKKLAEWHYVHAHQGFKEVDDVLRRYAISNQQLFLSNSQLGIGNEENAQEMKRIQMLYSKIAATMAELYKAAEVPACKDEESDIKYYVGLARNCTALNYLFCPPTVQLKGVAKITTLEELIKAWITYVKSETHSLDTVSYDNVRITYVKSETHSTHLDAVSYDNVGYELTEGVKVGDLVCPGLRKYYFCLNIEPGLRKHFLNLTSVKNNQQVQQEEDDRDINLLLEFIEGNDRKEQDKKKKRKKKKKGNEVAVLLAKGGALDAEGEAMHTGAEGLKTHADSFQADVEGEKARKAKAKKGEAKKAIKDEAEKAKKNEAEKAKKDETEKAKKDEAEKAKALEAKHQAKDAKDICHDGGQSNTVGGCKKKVQSKQRTADEKLKESISLKEAMLEDRRRYAENIMESKSKEMRNLITGFEEAEDHKAAKLKEVADIDERLEELKTTRAQLLVECEAKDEVMNKFTRKRKKLEEFITGQINKYKSETSQLEIEVKDLKMKQLNHNEEEVYFSDEDKTSNEVKTVKTPNLQLLDYIDQKIEAKEKELECPVCLEVASVPIFMCDELHLICSSCRPKVG